MSNGDKTVAEFFAGIGLMRLGLEAGGWRVIWANDIDDDKCRMYSDQFPDADGHLVQGDVHALDAAAIPSVDLATASFPCNDLSLAGARRGLSGQHSSAFWGFVRAVRDMKPRPPLVMLENVAGFLTSHKGMDFEAACRALNDLGYAVDAFIIDAAWFVPQSRQRLFIVGVQGRRARGLGKIEESLSFYQSQLRPAALADFILWHPDIDWAIRRLPQIPHRETNLTDILEEVPLNSTLWWSEERATYLLNQMSPKHRATAHQMINENKTTYGTVFRRVRKGKSMAELRTDGVAGCLRTPRGGSGRQILFAGGHGRYAVRLLTPRECARLMGADDFSIKTTSNKALFGFGDAVCVPVITWIAQNYLNSLWKEMHGSQSEIVQDARSA